MMSNNLYNYIDQNTQEEKVKKRPVFKRGFTFGGKHTISENRQSIPGPGQYNHNQKKIKGISFTKSTFPNVKSIPNVGPGSYEIPSMFKPRLKRRRTVQDYLKRAFQQRNSNQAYPSIEQDIPGPGKYDIPGTLGGSGFSMGNRTQSWLNSNSITQNFYNPSPPKKKGQIKIGTAERWKSNDQSSPGPGQYNNPSFKKNNSMSYGKEKRWKDMQKSPGPGQYTVNSSFSKRKIPNRKEIVKLYSKRKISKNIGIKDK